MKVFLTKFVKPKGQTSMVSIGLEQASIPVTHDELAPTNICKVGSPTQMLCLHNYARKINGIAQLKGNPLLYKAAMLKAEEMVKYRIFSHTPDGKPFTETFDQAGYQYIWAGENAAYGQRTVRDTFSAWLASSGHRDNILANYFTEFGSAHIQKGVFPNLWVVAFGSPR